MIFIVVAAGRPPKFVSFDSKNYVVGLSASRYKGNRIRFYATFSKPRKWFGVANAGDGKSKKKVVEDYKTWLAERGEEIQFVKIKIVPQRVLRRNRRRERRGLRVSIPPQYHIIADE